MGSISSFTSSYFPDVGQYPITLGIAAGLSHAILHATASVKLQNINASTISQNIEESNSIISTAESRFAQVFVIAKSAVMDVFVQPLYWELIFRDSIYTYVETNVSNAFAVNFVMMPILFGALHFDPRLNTPLLQPISYASLGCLLTLLRKETGGIGSSYTAQITTNLASGFLGGVIIGLQKVLREIKEKREKRVEQAKP